MSFSGKLPRVVLVRADISEERITSSVLRLPVTANVVPSSQILVALMMEAIISSETSVPIRVTRRHVPEDGILQVLSRYPASPHIPSADNPCRCSYETSFSVFCCPSRLLPADALQQNTPLSQLLLYLLQFPSPHVTLTRGSGVLYFRYPRV
jgi:hypothetical protein